MLVQGNWNAKVGADAQDDWNDYSSPACNDTTNERRRDFAC